jgi:hypothetical protein
MRVRIGDAEVEVTGPTEFVKAEIKQFMQRSPLAHAQETGKTSPAATVPQQGKPKSPAQFFKMSSPRSDVERTLAGAYFLEKYRNVPNSSASEIRDVIKEAKVPPPANVNDAINRNIRKGLMMSAGDRESKMVFVLTSDGEGAVEQMVTNVKS